MRARKISAKTVDRLVGCASHTAMGIAMGLVFAFITARSDLFGVRPLIEQAPVPSARLADFFITYALAFGVVATFTGFILTGAEDE